jgi:hypothetical protein
MKTTANNSNKEKMPLCGSHQCFFPLLAGSTIPTTPGAVDTAATAPKGIMVYIEDSQLKIVKMTPMPLCSIETIVKLAKHGT